MPYLIDSGILVRLLGVQTAEGLTIREAVRTVLSREGEAYVTVQNMAEFWNVSTRPATSRGGFGRTIQATAALLAAHEQSFTLLTESDTSYQIWRGLVLQHQVSGVQVHDARLVSVMLDRGLTHLLTLNPNDFKRYEGIIAITPDQVLANTGTPNP